MSRIGKTPIIVSDKVKIELKNGVLHVQGPKGSLSRKIPDLIELIISDKEIQVKRKNDSRQGRSLHGLTRTLVYNMVKGVTDTFERKLEIVGLGYKAQVQGQKLTLNLGYANPVEVNLPTSIQAKVDANTKISLTGPDKELLGDLAAKIRKLRLPEPYKGTGIKYEGEVIIRKVGKTAGSTTSS